MRPINFLTPSEQKELLNIKNMIDKCKHRSQLRILELTLDSLMLKSITRYKKIGETEWIIGDND